MGKIKVGVLIFTTQGSLVIKRQCRKNYFFDSFEYGGLNAVLRNLKYDFEYCSTKTIDEYDYVLVSLISFHDALNVIINIPVNRKAKIIVGGPACNNIRGYLRYIDIANFGRCDGDKINKIIEGKELKSVWYKNKDNDFSGNYEVDNATPQSLGENESSIGCQQKCSFCLYSHWNKFVRKKNINALNSKSYLSGLDGIRKNKEDFFQTLDWEKCKGGSGGITAIDGITEKTRFRINKKITYSDIVETLLRSNDVDFGDKKLFVKVYCIVGFPWEKPDELEELDLLKAAEEVKDRLKNKIAMRLHVTHFTPQQKTPLWSVPFNFNNYRDYCIKHRHLADCGKLQIYTSGVFTSSPILAAQILIIQRAFNEDEKYLRFIASPRFRKLNFLQSKRVLRKDFQKFFIEQSKETIGNIKTKYKY